MDHLLSFIEDKWATDCLPKLAEYIRIPCQSPAYDKEWASNGLLDDAMSLLYGWVREQEVPGMQADVHRAEGKVPFMVITVPASDPAVSQRILMYGHMDKQPPMLPWAEGLGPYTPVIRDDKLYGRGGADDGYAIFAAITSIQALQQAGVPHGPITVMIEADEESGSPTLPYWIEQTRATLGDPDLVICLDSGTLNYEQLWLTTSLRGAICCTLSVSLLSEGIHSGIYGGIVPDTFRIVRQLLSRIENEMTGEILLPEANCDIPKDLMTKMKELDKLGPDLLTRDIPVLEGCRCIEGTTSELHLANTWRPSLALTGVSGVPSVEHAGNVLRPATAVKFAIRLPPTVDAAAAFAALKKKLEQDPPFNAKVEVSLGFGATGWAAPPLVEWLDQALQETGTKYFGQPYAVCGLGGTIPFMGMLGKLFPKAQMVITGILGPKSNAHGPNEFLHIPYTKRLVACVAALVAAHFRHHIK